MRSGDLIASGSSAVRSIFQKIRCMPRGWKPAVCWRPSNCCAPSWPKENLRKARRALKHHLAVFGDLRDTQVQLVYVGRMAGAFPDAPVIL